MYSYNRYSSSAIQVNCFSYKYTSFRQLAISLKVYVYKLKAIRQITLKQAFFGEKLIENSSYLIIRKSDLSLQATVNNNAEALLIALFVKWLFNNSHFSKINIISASISLTNNLKILTYWLHLYDYPLDQYNNPDVSKIINPMDF